jgi:hypothetical protein
MKKKKMLMEEFSNVLKDKKTDNTTVKKKTPGPFYATSVMDRHGLKRDPHRMKVCWTKMKSQKRMLQMRGGCYFRPEPEGDLLPRELILQYDPEDMRDDSSAVCPSP